jgi:mRNA-degrading endonuclease RelE of RelBE toxin-antitoxin system
MTEVELTPKAEEQLDGLEPDVRERILKKLGEAREWPDHRSTRSQDGRTTNSESATTGQSSRGTAMAAASSWKR